MNINAKVVKKVVTRTVQIELDDKEYEELVKTKDWYLFINKNGQNYYQSTALELLSKIITAVHISETETT